VSLSIDQNQYGWTPLHSAALRGHVESAQLLLKADALFDEKDKVQQAGGCDLFDCEKSQNFNLSNCILIELS
jgi:ankyrin repeat protein